MGWVKEITYSESTHVGLSIDVLTLVVGARKAEACPVYHNIYVDKRKLYERPARAVQMTEKHRVQTEARM